MADIRVISYDKTGEITFSVDGRRYTYIMDAVYFYNNFPKVPFRSWLQYAPGKAFNFAKKHGKLIDPKPQTPEPEPEPQHEMPEGSCPSCGAQSHVEGVPCPNCGYPNEGFSFKRWLSATENCAPVNLSVR